MKKQIEFQPAANVCSRHISITVEDGRVGEVRFTGGCAGNTLGICKLVQGMPVEEVIGKLSGIDCKGKGTSCPDQLARALRGISSES
ncbi:MAG: TIGR03905 family TSCPD domain-containing protein [Rikenellaceae bacterium]|nr:TIGR03905 family TSCPD domain-containing protein [Rikenellaceae bacterium]